MIAVDTSAIMAIALKEPEAARCVAALGTDDRLMMSAGTLAETLIVAGQRGCAGNVARLIDDLNIEIVTVTPAVSQRTAIAYASWGKGVHPAALNFGDCFAYTLAKEHDCPLLYVGKDFERTDIVAAS